MTVQGPVRKQQPDGISHRGAPSTVVGHSNVSLRTCLPFERESSTRGWGDWVGFAEENPIGPLLVRKLLGPRPPLLSSNVKPDVPPEVLTRPLMAHTHTHTRARTHARTHKHLRPPLVRHFACALIFRFPEQSLVHICSGLSQSCRLVPLVPSLFILRRVAPPQSCGGRWTLGFHWACAAGFPSSAPYDTPTKGR